MKRSKNDTYINHEKLIWFFCSAQPKESFADASELPTHSEDKEVTEEHLNEPDTDTDWDTDSDTEISVRVCECTCEALLCPCCPGCEYAEGKSGPKIVQMRRSDVETKDRCYLKRFKKFPILEKIMQGVCACSKCRPIHFEKQDKIDAGTDESWFLETMI